MAGTERSAHPRLSISSRPRQPWASTRPSSACKMSLNWSHSTCWQPTLCRWWRNSRWREDRRILHRMMPREMRFAHFTRHHSIRVQKRSCEISPFVSIHIKRTVVCFWADSSKTCNFLAEKTLLLGERENSGNKSTERLDKRYIRQLIFSMSFFLSPRYTCAYF